MPEARARRMPEVEPFPDAPPRPRLRVVDDEDGRAGSPGRRHPGARVPTAPRPIRTPAVAPEERRTVVIGGQPTPQRRQPRAASRRRGSSPDRLALWAVGLALFMAFMAAATARAEAPQAGAAPTPAGTVSTR